MKKAKPATSRSRPTTCATHCFVQMEKTRAIADQIEPMVDKTLWPYPTYGDMLFSVFNANIIQT